MTAENTASIPIALSSSPRPITDIFRLIRILARAFLRYPRASVKALFYFFNVRTLDDKSGTYEPNDPELKNIFVLLKASDLPAQGELILPHKELWNDYLILSHVIAKHLTRQLENEEDILIKARWGLTHGIYNAIVHGEVQQPISVRWQIAPEEFCLTLVNAKNEERMKPHNVAVNGIPVSGVGGSLVIMRILFDDFSLSETKNAQGQEEIRLNLAHRCRRRRMSLRYTMAARIAHARDSIQLERIWRKRNKH